MKKVVLFDANGAFKSATSVKSVASLNGIPVRHVPALVAAWCQMGAARPRVGGGYYMMRFVKAKDPQALRLLAADPHAKPPVAQEPR